jgi:hypothetical protein
MKNVCTLLAVCIVILLASCGIGGGDKILSDDKTFEVTLPLSFLRASINDDATMQYCDNGAEVNFFVIRDKRADFKEMVSKYRTEYTQFLEVDSLVDSIMYSLGGYSMIVLHTIAVDCDEAATVDSRDTVINGMRVSDVTLNVTNGKEQAYVRLCIYEGREYYYQVYSMCPALLSVRNKEMMSRIVRSLREK